MMNKRASFSSMCQCHPEIHFMLIQCINSVLCPSSAGSWMNANAQRRKWRPSFHAVCKVPCFYVRLFPSNLKQAVAHAPSIWKSISFKRSTDSLATAWQPLVARKGVAKVWGEWRKPETEIRFDSKSISLKHAGFRGKAQRLLWRRTLFLPKLETNYPPS